MPFIAIAVALALAFGGSVAVEHAQPGDNLYQVKAAVNDHIGGSAQGFMQTLHIESKTDADINAEARAHGNSDSNGWYQNGTSTTGSVHSDANASTEVNSNTNVNVNANTGVHVGL